MKCLCFSDSHGYSDGMIAAIRKNPDADVVFFLGDGLSDAEDAARSSLVRCAWLTVRGNCDYRNFFLDNTCVLKTDEITLLGKKIVFTHGDLYNVKSSTYGLLELAEQRCADAVLFGHTHVAYHDITSVASRTVFLFNPGSVSPRSYPQTYGVIEITEKDISFSYHKI